nr:copia protein [Tanacetum cinerariifolium]
MVEHQFKFYETIWMHVTILNTIDHLGKFDSKAHEVSGPNWLYDIDALTRTMNYKPIVAGTQYNGFTDLRKEDECNDQEKEDNINNTNTVNTAGTNDDNELPFDPNMPALEDVSIFNFLNYDEDDGIVADMNNLDTTIQVSPIPTTRIHKNHHLDQVIRDLHLATQTRKMTNNLEEHWFVSTNQQRTNHKDLQNCLFACFLSPEEPKKGTQEEGINYDEVFSPIARIEAIRLLLAYASFKDFVVYQMDVKNVFLCGKIEEEVYVCQPPGFEDSDFPDRVYKVKKALYGPHQAPRAWYKTLSTYLLDNGFQRGKIDKTLFIKRYKSDILLVQVYVDDIIFGSTKKELCNAFERLMHEKFQMSYIGELTFFLGLQVKQKKDGIFISQDKYVAEILKKFRYKVNLKVSHLHAVKRIFRYLKGQPKLGLWYLKDSSFDLVASTYSDYAGASLDRKLEGRIEAMDADEDITLVNDQDDAHKNMFNVNVLGGKEVFATLRQKKDVVNKTTEELTLAQALEALKTSKPKVKGFVIQEPGETTITIAIYSEQSHDKGKGIMIEEPVKPKKKDQIRIDEEAAKRLQAEFDKEERQEKKLKKNKKPILP